ncbi:MAG: LolA family protein [Cyclonatronaceae bacterium]
MLINKLFYVLFLVVPVWTASAGTSHTGTYGKPETSCVIYPESDASVPGCGMMKHEQDYLNQVTRQDESKITELRERFSNGNAFTAFMTHEYVDSFTSDTVITTGTIWIGTDSYKVITDQQRVTVDGSISKVYNRPQNKLIISFYDPEEDEFAPSRFLTGAQDRYIMEETDFADGTVITLTSDDPFEMFREVRIHLNEKGIPRLITGIDQTGNEFSTFFESGVFIQATGDLFKITWPDNAEVVDLRN